ncbi:MAG: hypothetical protein V4722_06625 [Bacteroidota bacterium]
MKQIKRLMLPVATCCLSLVYHHGSAQITQNSTTASQWNVGASATVPATTFLNLNSSVADWKVRNASGTLDFFRAGSEPALSFNEIFGSFNTQMDFNKTVFFKGYTNFSNVTNFNGIATFNKDLVLTKNLSFYNGGSYYLMEGLAGNLHMGPTGATNPQFSLLSNGNVGIGNAAPANKLDVNGTVNATVVNATQYKLNGSDVVFGGGASQVTDLGTPALSWTVGNTTPAPSSTLVLLKSGTQNWNLHNFNGDLKFYSGSTAQTPLLYLANQSQNIGIGTTTPNQKLEVNDGNIRINLLNGAGTRTNWLEFHENISKQTIKLAYEGSNVSGTSLDYFRIRSSDNPGGVIMTMDRENRVGINMDIPTGDYKLGVNGKVNATEYYENGVRLTAGGSGPWTKTGTIVNYDGGNVGIGTASPSEKLQVEGNTKVNGTVNATVVNATEYHLNGVPVNMGSGGSGPWAVTGSNIYYSTGSTGTGKVGIGITSPTNTLHVAGTARIGGGILGGGNLYLQSQGSNNTTTMPVVLNAICDNTNNDVYAQYAVNIGSNHAGFVQSKAGAFMRIDMRPTQPLFQWGYRPAGDATPEGNVTPVAYAAISQLGNFGIGTYAPSEKLHVVGNAKIDGTITATGNVTTTGSVNASAYLVNGIPLGTGPWTKTGTVVNYNDGNVGIGTATPTQKLHVVGKAIISDSLGIGTTSPTEKLHVANMAKVGGAGYGLFLSSTTGLNTIQGNSGIMAHASTRPGQQNQTLTSAVNHHTLPNYDELRESYSYVISNDPNLKQSNYWAKKDLNLNTYSMFMWLDQKGNLVLGPDGASGYSVNNTNKLHVVGKAYITDSLKVLKTIDARSYTVSGIKLGEWRESGSHIAYNVGNSNVGIGTNDPTEKLDVVGNAKVSGTLAVTGAISAKSLLVDGKAVEPVIKVGSNISFAPAATDLVGIGTANPTTKLQVNGSVRLAGSNGLGSTYFGSKSASVQGVPIAIGGETVSAFGSRIVSTINSAPGYSLLYEPVTSPDQQAVGFYSSTVPSDLYSHWWEAFPNSSTLPEDRIKMGLTKEGHLRVVGNIGIGKTIPFTHKLNVDGNIGAIGSIFLSHKDAPALTPPVTLGTEWDPGVSKMLGNFHINGLNTGQDYKKADEGGLFRIDMRTNNFSLFQWHYRPANVDNGPANAIAGLTKEGNFWSKGLVVSANVPLANQQNQDVIPGFVAHFDGRVHISEAGVNSERKFKDLNNSNYKDYGLWVEEGIVSKDFAIADTTDWPDYVFEEGYKLPSLTEIENTIKEKGHLHTMPAAADVEKNGYTVGDMTRRMVTTIEELTLHAIELKKQLDTQKSEKEVQEKLVKELMQRLVKLEENAKR